MRIDWVTCVFGPTFFGLVCSYFVHYVGPMQTSLTFATDNRLPEILDRLRARFPSPSVDRQDPLRQLVFGMVSEGAGPAVGVGVFNRLMAAYPHWAALRDAEPEALATLFVGLPRAAEKAEAVPEVLRAIEARVGDLSLDGLSKMNTEAAKGWLTELPGVSLAVASAVLAFSSLERPTVSIEGEAARVVRRLELCPAGAALSAVPRHVMERAPAHWRAKEFGAMSDGLKRLARVACHQGRAACAKCPLQDLCPSRNRQSATIIPFNARLKDGDTQPAAAEKVLSK